MLLFENVLFALISSRTLYIGHVQIFCPLKKREGGSSEPPDPPLPTPLNVWPPSYRNTYRYRLAVFHLVIYIASYIKHIIKVRSLEVPY